MILHSEYFTRFGGASDFLRPNPQIRTATFEEAFTAKMSKLLALPNELLLGVASQLPRVDVVHLEKSCRDLYKRPGEYVYTNHKDLSSLAGLYGIEDDYITALEKAIQYGLDINLGYRHRDSNLIHYTMAWRSPLTLTLLLKHGATPPPIPVLLERHKIEMRDRGKDVYPIAVLVLVMRSLLHVSMCWLNMRPRRTRK